MTATLDFGRFELQPLERRLLVDGASVTVGSRAFDVLLALAERAGRLVSKQELLDLAWPGLVVEENNLQVQIGTLRRLLGAQAIATIPGRGYRLAVERREVGAAHPPAAPPPPADAATTTDLFGRDADVAALGELVRAHGVVTVVGPAGIGKTRLAQVVAQLHGASFDDGARIAELSPLADPSLVEFTVARALGVTIGTAPASFDAVLEAMRSRRLLLVLDNCEHLLDAVDTLVASLRRRAAGVHVLATSQELLRHPDEHVYRLGPLRVPADGDPEVAQAGAVQLFVARVRALAGGFALTPANAAGVVEICRRLDGIPLAIELGAARVPLLGVDGVRQRLDERFRLLTGGARVALRRHQTLRAALEWSHGLLDATEQEVFAAVGVFPGSFSLEAIQALVEGPDLDAWTALEKLGALVDKSLIAVEGGAGAAEPRYRLLETTRAFALERLASSGAMPRMLRRHAEITLGVFERAHDEVRSGVPSASLVGRLAPEIDNLSAALRWAAGSEGDDRLAVALFGAAVAGQGHFHFYALGADTWRWREVLRARVGDAIPAPIAARFWAACAEWGGALAPGTTEDDARHAIALYTQLGDRLGTFRAWQALAYARSQSGRFTEALEAMGEALALRDPRWPEWILAIFDNMAGIVYLQAGEPARARPHLEAFVEVCRRGDALDDLNATSLLIDLEVAEGRIEEAAAHAAALLARPEALTVRWSDGRGVRSLGTALLLGGRLDDAERAYRHALGNLRRYYGTGATVLLDAATWLARRGRHEDAARIGAYSELAHARLGSVPRFVARRLRAQTRTELAARFPAEVFERLENEGRALDEEAACELAFPSAARH
jgi:predicted ATPase/DNA-binding winged helix-turn-helix (wHTH) protein